jgi:hypothetical protein
LCCRPRLSAPAAAAASLPPLPFAPSHCPPGPMSPDPACQPLTLSQPRPAALPYRTTAPLPAPDGRSRCRPLRATDRCASPLSAPSPAPTWHRVDPLLFPRRPALRALSKAANRRPRSPSSLSAPRAAASQLPHRACPHRPTSPHHLTTERLSHRRRRPSAPSVSRVLRASGLTSGMRLTFSLLLRCCRTPPPAPPMTGAPPPPP